MGNKVEHALFVHLKLSTSFPTVQERNDIHDLEEKLIMAFRSSNVGEVDGLDFGQGQSTLYIYGPNADDLFNTAEPVLRASKIARGARVRKRFGTADGVNVRIVEYTLEG